MKPIFLRDCVHLATQLRLADECLAMSRGTTREPVAVEFRKVLASGVHRMLADGHEVITRDKWNEIEKLAGECVVANLHVRCCRKLVGEHS